MLGRGCGASGKGFFLRRPASDSLNHWLLCAGDQPANAAKLQRAGMARAILPKGLTSTAFLQLLKEMLMEPSARGFAAAALRMQDMSLAHAANNKAMAGES